MYRLFKSMHDVIVMDMILVTLLNIKEFNYFCSVKDIWHVSYSMETLHLLTTTKNYTLIQPILFPPIFFLLLYNKKLYSSIKILSSFFLHHPIIYLYCEFREPPILQVHNGSNLVLKLPQGKRIRDIKWISVWCRRFTVCNFSNQLEIKG